MTPSEREEIEKIAKKILQIASKKADEEGHRLNILRSKKGLMPLYGEEASLRPFIIPLITEAILTQVTKARAEERERCAKICDEFEGNTPMQSDKFIARYLGGRIRNRLEKE